VKGKNGWPAQRRGGEGRRGIAASGSNFYVSGYTTDASGTWTPALWVNGVYQALATQAASPYGYGYSARSLR
jgi:hypothetical protein